ncbi:MAG TPA: hypothetical protein DEP41_03940, partial [Rhodobacter sp.]|nr:hypothetical protein [Rhodobacter sp.]
MKAIAAEGLVIWFHAPLCVDLGQLSRKRSPLDLSISMPILKQWGLTCKIVFQAETWFYWLLRPSYFFVSFWASE